VIDSPNRRVHEPLLSRRLLGSGLVTVQEAMMEFRLLRER
jgi:hypothetical protein